MSPQLSKPPCSPTKRRRGVSRNLSRSARNRHCARSDCCINTICRPLTSLDDLPWISALTIEPDSTNPWDIADLSLLDHSLGPVRRRKTSLRSNPMDDPDSSPLLPSQLPLPVDDLPSRPTTPEPSHPSLLPSAVLFRNLMPVSPNSPSCISIQDLAL